MEQIKLQLSGPKSNETEIIQAVEVLNDENYYLALSRSLKKAQDDFNSLLTDIIDKKRLEGAASTQNAKKLKKK